MFPIRKFTTGFDGLLRLEFTVSNDHCIASVEPTHVVLLPDGTMAIAIRQHLDGRAPPVVRYAADGEVDARARLEPAAPKRRRRT